MYRFARKRATALRILLTLCLACFVALQARAAKDASQGESGEVMLVVSDILGRSLPAKVELYTDESDKPVVVRAPKGTILEKCPLGQYKAHIYVYEFGVPVLVDIRDVTVTKGQPALVLLELVEGSSGQRSLLDPIFDMDMDLVLDSLEAKVGTATNSAASLPSRFAISFNYTVINKKEGWYRGELHARSSYGGGSEPVAKLVKRAEQSKLDFLAITDRNTMAACMDPDFKSKSVVLLPAMEWGDEKRGVALIYGARSLPEQADSYPHAQALLRRVQAQGGIFAIAHPCFPTAPWQWGLEYVNAIEVWCHDWNDVPPATVEQLDVELQARGPERLARDEQTGGVIAGKTLPGKHLYPIANALATPDLSANGKAEVFWDGHLASGLKVSPIGGSLSSNPKVPLASPITYVYATQKSVAGILDGLRRGRTYVSSGLDGPQLGFFADTNKDETVDTGMGGAIPLGVESDLIMNVKKANGKKLQLLRDGLPVVSKLIDDNNFYMTTTVLPKQYHVFRIRVIDAVQEPANKASFGNIVVCALSSPIYAQSMPEPGREENKTKGQDNTPPTGEKDDEGNWLRVPPSDLPPVYATGVTPDGEAYVTIDQSPRQPFIPPDDANAPVDLPEGAEVRELKPTIIK